MTYGIGRNDLLDSKRKAEIKASKAVGAIHNDFERGFIKPKSCTAMISLIVTVPQPQ